MPDTHARHTRFALMHLSFLFSGAGTLLLGPVLPVFALGWHLRDSQSGFLIAAQFFGLFLGAIALSRNLRNTLLCGYLIAAAAFFMLAVASRRGDGHLLGIAALFLLGIGLGQITTTVNLLSALRFPSSNKRSSALSLLNFTWSAGAVVSSLIAGFYLAHASLFLLLLSFGASALVLFSILAWAVPGTVRSGAAVVTAHAMPARTLIFFFLLFFIYGGLEATVGGWLSTYALRYASLGLAAVAYATTALWAAFAAGRALAAGLLRVVPERVVRAAGLLLATLATASLRGAHTGLAIELCAICIGLGIAPFFPVTFSLLMAHAPSPRQAGAATANIGLGSAVMPYLTGVLSTHLGSLQSAMIAPIAIAIALLTLCSIRSTRSAA